MSPEPTTNWAFIADLVFNCGVPIFLLALGFAVGGITDRRHRADLDRREADLAGVLVTNLRRPPGVDESGEGGVLVAAEVVVATDYFKSFVAGLVKIIGGEMRTYRSLMERARREALARLAEEATAMGYDALCNIRMETADIGGGATSRKRTPAVMVSVLAWGTAYTRPPEADEPPARPTEFSTA